MSVGYCLSYPIVVFQTHIVGVVQKGRSKGLDVNPAEWNRFKHLLPLMNIAHVLLDQISLRVYLR